MSYGPLPAGSKVLPNGDIQVAIGNRSLAAGRGSFRLKAKNGKPAGYPLHNAAAFTKTYDGPTPTVPMPEVPDPTLGLLIIDGGNAGFKGPRTRNPFI